ncbi:MAG: ral nucleoside transport system permease protein [Acidobacteriota bacterium]|jgi:simple sugar transport system permease protein|nr:ral nucleoside transport system permease protein [Acidobacteriota bacterium]
MMNLFKFALLASTIRLATPLLLAALGGMFSERAGVINIALEGLMLAGAFTAATVTHLASVHGYPGAPWIGLLAAILAGVVVAGIHALACIKYKADQVVTGTAINILFLGVPALLSGALFDSTGATPQVPLSDLMPASLIVAALAVVLYAAFIVRATALKNQSRGVQLGIVLILAGAIWSVLSYTRLHSLLELPVATWIALALVPISWYVLGHTPFGLRLRAVGENPEAADTAGVSVARIRYTGVLLSGALAAIGGAYLSIGQSSLFTRNMTAGRGFIALAALIFGKWRPFQTMLACLFFGFAEAVAIQMQGVVNIPVQFIQIIPYVLTIVVLAGFIGLSRAPRALGIPYQKEK